FLVAISALLDFRYLAQMPCFDNNALTRVEAALQRFHNHKSAIITAGGRQGSNGPLKHWEIPKLELLQHVVPSICASGAVMQWTADVTEHAHVTEIKQPAHSGNNQDYYIQIAQHLDRSEKCFRFDIVVHLASTEHKGSDKYDEDQADEHEPDSEALRVKHYYSPTRKAANYFEMAKALASDTVPNTVLPHKTFASSTIAFRLALKPSLRVLIDEAAEIFGLPDLRLAIADYFNSPDRSVERCGEISNHPEQMQIWFKVRVQQPTYHDPRSFEPPQSLVASPPSTRFLGARYDCAIVSPSDESDWPSNGLRGHAVVQIRLIFHLLHSQTFLAYIQRFNATSPPSSNTTDSAAGMHILRRVVRNGIQVGDIIPLHHIRFPAHLIPCFGKEVNLCLTRHTCYDLSNEFWLNKYWNKELFFCIITLA
ncbi:hypothetical protein OG21DRAFT_1427336, partial [Imleria badia]